MILRNASRTLAALLVGLLGPLPAAAETVTYLVTDTLGSPVAAMDASGALLWRESYTPYGEKRNNPSQADNDSGYTGHQSDVASGLTYMQARYYDPVVGRFLAVDPVGFTADNPMSFNRHSYANNNPFRYTDPDGRQSVGEMIDLAAEGCGRVSCAGWAVLNAAWKVMGAEGVSQIADKGWSSTSGGDRTGASLEVAGVVPIFKLVRGAQLVPSRLARGAAAGPNFIVSSSGVAVDATIAGRWAQGTFGNLVNSIEYHFAKHGAGRTLQQYTDDAARFFQQNRSQAQLGKWNPNWQESYRLKVDNQGGYFTADGKILTYWD